MSYPLDRFYYVNRIFLSIAGLWPYQDKKTNLIKMLSVQLILLCGYISHFAKLASIGFDMDIFLKVLPFSFLCLCILVMYCGNLAHVNVIKIAWDRIQYDWNELMSIQEMNVLEQYASTSKMYTIVFIGTFYMGEIFIILQTILPVFLDVVLPLNESRPIQLFIPMEFMFDQEKYFFSSVLLLSIALCNVGIVTAATYGLFVVYVQHACGMFRLVGFTLDEAYVQTDRMSYTNKENNRISKSIIRSIRIHRRAIEFTEFINVIFEKPYLLQLLLSTFIVGINILQLFKMRTNKEATSDMIICLLQTFGTFFSGFIFHLICQSVIDHSMDIFEQAYITPWHMLYPKTQRLLLVLMMKSLKPCYISIGNMFVACNELYSTFLQTALSYATVIYNLQ